MFFETAGEQFGGITEDFQQGNPESYGWINLDPKTREGACYALAVFWMIKHRKGEDFWGWVKRPSGIKAINNTFVSSEAAKNQDKYMFKVLRNHGLRHKSGWDYNGEPVQPQTAALQLLRYDGYKVIGLYGVGGGHAMAAIINGREARFYDPNYGEVSFRSKVNLGYWFVTWWKSNEDYRQELGQEIEIFHFV